MARILTTNDKRKIIESIKSWSSPNKMTWEGLCDSVAKKIGRRPTRQSLYMHKDIVTAYEEKKGVLKTKNEFKVRPANLKAAAERIERLESKIEEHVKTINVQREYMIDLFKACVACGVQESDLKFRP